ncbi:MAG: prefoldin subunit alpha [Candidatus Bathyarchaeota archaeon]|nr:prefoldin subunit alpha [Candidatus Bathyarchaeota archaeon]
MAVPEDQLSRLIMEIQFLERTFEELQSRIGLVNASINEFRLANATLEGMQKEETDTQILVHIGGGSYVKAKIADTQKLIMSIGADVAAEKSVDAAKESLDTRLQEFEKVRESLEQQLGQTQTRISTLRQQLQKMSQEVPKGQT